LCVSRPDARRLVAAERRMGGAGGVAVRPYAARLDGAAKPGGAIAVASPLARAKAVERVIGDGGRVVLILELRDRDDRPEYLFLEHPHLVVAFEDRRFDVIALDELAFELRALAAGEDFGAFLLADVEIGQDLLELVVGGLRADHRRRVEWRPCLIFLVRATARSMNLS
jgi:hypothetical protein